MKIIFSILCVTLFLGLFSENVSSQWVKVQDGSEPFITKALLANGSYIYAGIYNFPNASIGVLRSSNNGAYWTQTSLNFQKVNSLCAIGNYIFAGTVSIGVYVSSNNGDTWTQTPLNNVTVYSLASSGNNLFAGTKDSGLYKSTNFGDTWTRTSLPITSSTASILCNNNEMYVGAFWQSYKSTNSGATWSPMSLDNVFVYCFAINGNNIFAGTTTAPSVYSVQKSTNSGSTWSSSGGFLCYAILNYGSNMIAGQSYISTDNGGTWVNKSEGMSEGVYSLAIFNNYIFAGTQAGRIFRRPLSEIIGIQQISSEVPQNFSLEQNYPNPFNPTTQIEFGIPKTSFVLLKVYDMLGKELETLIKQELLSGIYKVDFDAKKYPSGLYFYRLETKDFVETKKMILIK